MKKFMCGVCEGFYGRPWSFNQRLTLFKRMETMKMTTYLYAPKDDIKHRMKWRELYNEKECSYLQDLIETSKQCSITFIYAISPGLDIEFSKPSETMRLLDKLQQVKDLGCTSFAILFDDIDNELSISDEKAFPNSAMAQATITNKIYTRLECPEIFLFCPTEYCATRAIPEVEMSSYLYSISKHLLNDILLLWTGERVISEQIKSDDLARLAVVIGHRRGIVLWENLHANDYDHARVYLGPYKGRSKHLLDDNPRYTFNGVLANPNCEFEANFIALHTLSQWSLNTVCRFRKKEIYSTALSDKSETEMDVVTPSPDTRIIDEDEVIVEELEGRGANGAGTVGGGGGEGGSGGGERGGQSEIMGGLRTTLTTNVDEDEDEGMVISACSSQMKMEIEPEEYNPNLSLIMAIKDWIDIMYLSDELNSNQEIIPKSGKIKVDQMCLIIDMYFLPYEYGQTTIDLIKKISWLISNLSLISSDKEKSSSDYCEWYNRAIHLYTLNKRLTDAFDAFGSITNSSLLYTLHSYMNDVRSAINQAVRYIRWQGMNCEGQNIFTGRYQEAWVNTGGLVAEIKRLIPITGQLDLYPIDNGRQRRVISPDDSSPCRPHSRPHSRHHLHHQCRDDVTDTVSDETNPPGGNTCVATPPSNMSSMSSSSSSAGSTPTYIVNQYHASDKANIYKYLTRRRKGSPSQNCSSYLSEMLSDDCQIRFLLRLYPEYCFLLSDESFQIVGFVLATPSICQFRHEIKSRQYFSDGEMKESNASCCYAVLGQASGLSRISELWPAYLVSYVDCPNFTAVSALFSACYRQLSRVGVKGVHVAINDQREICRYRSLGFTLDSSIDSSTGLSGRGGAGGGVGAGEEVGGAGARGGGGAGLLNCDSECTVAPGNVTLMFKRLLSNNRVGVTSSSSPPPPSSSVAAPPQMQTTFTQMHDLAEDEHNLFANLQTSSLDK